MKVWRIKLGEIGDVPKIARETQEKGNTRTQGHVSIVFPTEISVSIGGGADISIDGAISLASNILQENNYK